MLNLKRCCASTCLMRLTGIFLLCFKPQFKCSLLLDDSLEASFSSVLQPSYWPQNSVGKAALRHALGRRKGQVRIDVGSQIV